MLSKYPTPSGLPPVEFDEPPDLWQCGGSATNELDAIVNVGIWPPPQVSCLDAIKMRRGLDVWVAGPRRGRAGFAATVSWWESRRIVFNAILLAVCIPSVLLLLLVSVIRVWVFRIAEGSGPFTAAVDFSSLIFVAAAANVCYTLLCWIEVIMRAAGSVKTHFGLDMWQFCVIFSLAAIALAFFLTLPVALGYMYRVPL